MVRSLFFLLLSAYALGASQTRTYIQSLAYSDPEIKKIRVEVSQNLRLIADGRTPAIKWRRYKLRKKDNFFQVMARTSLNHDTLSSVNRLASLWDTAAGDDWLVPNVRGIAVHGTKIEVAKQFNRSAEELVAVPGIENLWFITGLHFEESEKEFFSLKAFIRPVVGKLTSAFGVRKDPFTEKHRFHKGIDIGVPVGTSVVASASGKVVFVGKRGGYGKAIMIEHRNGYQTLYGHLSRYHVKKGAQVKQGQKIASSGMTGRATGPHVHFEVRRQGHAERPNFHLSKI